jgi:transcriptional regulator with XRE-family HTH domain
MTCHEVLDSRKTIRDFSCRPKMSPTLHLNATWLRNRVAELGLRQWWLAEQLGVDRRTVLRWINGQVRNIAAARAQALAQVLGCRVDELLLHEPGRELASAQDQRAAGLALAASALLDRLGPVGEWDVVEQLVRASAVPDLPVHVLGRLYQQLCVACWRQDKLAESAEHNTTALALAARCGDQALRAEALGSRANLEFWRGEVDAALATWHEALALAPWLSPRQRGALHNNLGAALAETGQAEAGRHQLLLALACFDTEGTPMNHAITQGLLALLALKGRDIPATAAHTARARHHARRGDYRRGLALADLLDAVGAAWSQQAEQARTLLGRGLAAFAEQGIAESLNQRLAAETWLALGEQTAARAAADEALRLAAGFPVERQAAEAMSLRVTGAAAPPPVRSRPSPP